MNNNFGYNNINNMNNNFGFNNNMNNINNNFGFNNNMLLNNCFDSNFINFNPQLQNIQPINNNINYKSMIQNEPNYDYNSGQIEIKRKVDTQKNYEYLSCEQKPLYEESNNNYNALNIYIGDLKKESQIRLLENPYLTFDYL